MRVIYQDSWPLLDQDESIDPLGSWFQVIARGDLSSARNPSAALLARIRDAPKPRLSFGRGWQKYRTCAFVIVYDCLCMCVNMYIYMYNYVYMYMDIYIERELYIYMFIYTCIHIHVYM